MQRQSVLVGGHVIPRASWQHYWPVRVVRVDPWGEIASWSSAMVDATTFNKCRFLIESSMYRCWYLDVRIKDERVGPAAHLVLYTLPPPGATMGPRRLVRRLLESLRPKWQLILTSECPTEGHGGWGFYHSSFSHHLYASLQMHCFNDGSDRCRPHAVLQPCRDHSCWPLLTCSTSNYLITIMSETTRGVLQPLLKQIKKSSWALLEPPLASLRNSEVCLVFEEFSILGFYPKSTDRLILAPL
ncbi:conserved hypothetical protein [Ricinus communis]|uniref:Uncharacterized protein n=1 Tax=Ricinus communis TaxID=3988 RepID=B9RX18_RICCO|nr:conserved hypothetical protein [Ricinus communis]